MQQLFFAFQAQGYILYPSLSTHLDSVQSYFAQKYEIQFTKTNSGLSAATQKHINAINQGVGYNHSSELPIKLQN